MPTRLIPYTDAKGRRHWIEVSADLALDLHVFDRAAREAEREYRARVRPETDVKARRKPVPRKNRSPIRLTGFLNVQLETAYRVFQRVEEGNPWEGPRYSFTHLLGESPTWPGPGGMWRVTDDGMYVCAVCNGRKLASHQYCLNCDRSGRDA